MTILGIDPGNTGGLVWLNSSNGESVALGAERMPMLGKDPDASRLARLISEALCVAYENTRGIRPVRFTDKNTGEEKAASGHKAAESRGLFRGLILGICAARGIPCIEVTPAVWQRSLPLAGLKGQDRKAKIVRLALERWPSLPIKCKRDWGMADAAWIAEHWRTTKGGPSI